jgi:hypothetical protein
VAFDPEWFSHPPWLFVSNPKPVPPELASRGLTQAEWNQWMGKLHALRKKLPIFSHPRQLLFSIGTLLTLGTLSCMLPAPGKRAFLRGLLDWQRQFNAECLHKHDITVKTQSYSYKSSYAGPYKVSVISWLVFALGAEEGKLLEAVSHIYLDGRHGTAAAWASAHAASAASRCTCVLPIPLGRAAWRAAK